MENKKLSAATQRAYNYPNRGNEWLCSFQYTEVQGLGYEEGVHRRDPSSIIKVDDTYYVWYTKSIGMFYSAQDIHEGTNFKLYPWDQADIFYATSKNGIKWEEQGPAIRRGKKGDYDDRTVCTPEILVHDNKYYLVYQSVCDPYNGYNEKVGMAMADSPDGPWTKTKKQILAPKENGKWFGDTDTYNSGHYFGSVHDPLLIPFNNQFYLYYKCCCYHNGETIRATTKYAGPDTRWGVAMCDTIDGDYVPCELNPITNSGHEPMLWQYQGGIAALLNRDGPERDTIQYSKDGINFEIMSHVYYTPQAGGAFRADNNDDHPLNGIKWGLCHVDERGSLWNHIVRFDIDPRHPYSYPLEYAKGNSYELR